MDLEGREVVLASGEGLSYDHLVVATGARVRRLGVPGEDLPGVFHLRDLADAVRIRKFLEKNHGQHAVVVGAGFIALEMAEGFSLRDMAVTMLYRGDLPARRFGPSVGQKIKDHLDQKGVDFRSGTRPTAIAKTDHGLAVTTDRGVFEADVVLAALGVSPNTALAEAAGLALGAAGAIRVDEYLQTSRPGVWAVGDCATTHHRVSNQETWLPLGDVANRQGRVAGENIAAGNIRRFPGVVGAQCFKVFDLQVAAAGLSADQAAKAGFDPVSVEIRGLSRAGSYPGSQPIWLEMVADKKTGLLLGGRGVGVEGVVERINVIATALFAGLTVDQVGYLDLAYAPPFGGSWNPIQIAAQKLEGKLA
ncbi:MAG: FAD-dependent oxidoreductase [Proteobacteria bacterium]|nr:FAD-dependent oxidoreductase [Pseudomonadota bacterium]MBU1741875.1 FAD-dependent oxidoreductase [Pseudomonadota bacterium]